MLKTWIQKHCSNYACNVKRYVVALILILVDWAAFHVALVLSLMVMVLMKESPSLGEDPSVMAMYARFWWLPFIVVFYSMSEGLYMLRYSLSEELKKLLKSLLLSYFTIAALFLYASNTHVDKTIILMLFLFSVLIYPVVHYMTKAWLYTIEVWKKNVVILGAGKTGRLVAEGLVGYWQYGYNVIGFLDDDAKKQGDVYIINDQKIKVLGTLTDAEDIVAKSNVEIVILAISNISSEEKAAVTNKYQKKNRTVFVVPNLKGIPLLNTKLLHLFKQELFMLRIDNNLRSLSSQILKGVFDFTVALMLMPILLPVLAVIAVAIKLDSKGPIFHTASRIGKRNVDFKCFKFRTMYSNNDEILQKFLSQNPEAKAEWDVYKKIKGEDPRVTKIGRILRKTSLDELPQIFNVLNGTMSLVGPRPYLPKEKIDMQRYIDIIPLAKPGITGLWQVSGRNEVSFEQRQVLDSWYVYNWSVWFDITILMKTVKVLLFRKGAY